MVICTECEQSIGYEWYGTFKKKIVCMDCIKKEFDDLSDREKIEALNMTPEYETEAL